jgi:tetratricopeptide (TPR) repeat protein
VTEDDYMAELSRRAPEAGDASLELIALADEAIRVFPRSARLWCVRGDIIQIGPENNPHALDEALASFRRAIELDPGFADAWEEIGHFYDAVLDDERGAEPYFREAARLRREHAA